MRQALLMVASLRTTHQLDEEYSRRLSHPASPSNLPSANLPTFSLSTKRPSTNKPTAQPSTNKPTAQPSTSSPTVTLKPTIKCTNGEMNQAMNVLCATSPGDSIDECCSYLDKQSSSSTNVCSTEQITRISLSSSRANSLMFGADTGADADSTGNSSDYTFSGGMFDPLEHCTVYCGLCHTRPGASMYGTKMAPALKFVGMRTTQKRPTSQREDKETVTLAILCMAFFFHGT